MDAFLLIAGMFATSFLVGMSGAATPGPLLMVNITEVVRGGFWAAPKLALGHSLLELLVVALLAFGLSPLLQSGLVAGLVGLIGGGFLIWMAQDLIHAAGRLSLAASLAAVGPAVPGGPLVAGVTASATNPYWVVWWATAGASLMAQSLTFGVTGLAAFYLGHITADFSWYSFTGALVATGRRFMTDLVYRALLVCCAVFMLALGLFFVLSAVAAFLGVRLM